MEEAEDPSIIAICNQEGKRKAGVNWILSLKTDTNTDTDADTETDTETDANLGTKTKAGTDTEVNTDLETDTEAELETDTETDTKTDAETRVKTDTKTDAETIVENGCENLTRKCSRLSNKLTQILPFDLRQKAKTTLLGGDLPESQVWSVYIEEELSITL